MFTSLGNAIPRNGLVGEWLLDGNALDTSGNGYNGTNSNGVYVKTYKGYQSQAWQGNGSNAYISLPSGIGLSLTGNQSYNFWIKLNGQPGTGLQYRLWNNYGSTSPYGMFISYRDTAGVKDIIMSYGTTSTSSGSLTLTTGTAYMITCIHDDTNDIDSIYVNGNLFLSVSGKTQNPASTTATRHIGAEDGASKFTNGDLQLFRVYNKVLSQDEIQLLYLEGQRLLGPTSVAKYPKLFEGLVYYADFKGTAHNLVDGVVGTVSGATLTTDRFGNSNSAYSFPGTTNNIQTTLSSLSTGDFTINIILKFNGNSTFQGLIANNSATWGGLAFFNGGPYIYLSVLGNNVANSGNFTPIIGQYYNLTLTRIGNLYTIYKDGTLWFTHTLSGNFSSGSVQFGSANSSLPFNGVIDEVIILNRGLSADEVKLLYTLTSQDYIYPTPNYSLPNLQDGLLIHLNGTNNGTTTLYDISGNGKNGTVSSTPTYKRQGRIKTISLSSQSISWTSTSFTTSTCFEKVSGKWVLQVNPAYITTTGVSSGTREITDIRLYNRSLTTVEQEQLKYSKLGNFIY